VLTLALLLVGCSLPLPHNPKSVAGVEAEQQRSGELLQVIPPGPREGQTPEETVSGFLGAQANADHRHAIARSFLTSAEAQAWDDNVGVQVYDLNRQKVARTILSGEASDEATVTVSSTVTGQIGADGSYTTTTAMPVESYRLQLVKGQWRLSDVPPGLRLTAADRERSFRPANVYYLAQTRPTSPPHLVPDRVFLPAGRDLAPELVRRLLTAPSQALRGSVVFRPGVRTTGVTTSGSGVVTVDLAPVAPALSPIERQDLSARLVWTLRQLGPRFVGLRLLMSGRPVEVPGQGEVQDDGAWDSYDPEGVGTPPPYYFVASRRLRSSAQLPATTATAGDPGVRQAIGVDAVAVTPDRAQIALLDGVAPGPVTVRTGPLRGPTYRVVVRATDLRAPTWGSGEQGLWLLRHSRDIVLLPPGGSALRAGTIVGKRPGGAFTDLAVSRDGARVALVAGGRLYVGRVELGQGLPRVGDLAALDVGLRATTVAWSSGTQLAVLAVARTGQGQVLRVAVDGSAVDVVNSSGLTPTQVAASPAGLLVTSGGVLYSLAGRAPVKVTKGTAPAYPG